MASQDNFEATKPKKPQSEATGQGPSDLLDTGEAAQAAGCRRKTVNHTINNDTDATESCDGCQRTRSTKKPNGHAYSGRSPESASGPILASYTTSPGDDMENYFNANAHMLHDADFSPEARGVDPQWCPQDQGFAVYDAWIANDRVRDEGVELTEETEVKTAAYLSREYLGAGADYMGRCDSNDSLYNHCEDDLYQMNVANSVEDIGDFIETDIPKNPYGSSDSNSSRSRSLSDDDLPTLALESSCHVTGAGDIQGALSLDWNLQYNIESVAKRPPTLMVTSNRSSALSSESNGYKPRTVSDTDYGFFTPTSGASGSSLRTQSVQSLQLSDPSGANSAESSAFVSPDNETPLVLRPPVIFPRGPECACPSDTEGFVHKHSENLNLDRLSLKSSKDKHIEVKVHNQEPEDKEHRRRNKGSGASGEASAISRGRDVLQYGHNDLNPRSQPTSHDPRSQPLSHDLPEQFNVSRQTSTSDFDQDENSFQEIVDFPPGLMSCTSCDEDDDDDDDDDDAAFHPEQTPPQPAAKPQNHHPILLSHSHESLDNLLSAIPVIQIPPGDVGTDAAGMEDIPLPPQTPILNRQWLKKAAKYLDYNFLYKSLFKDDNSDSDSDSDCDLEEADLTFDLEARGQGSGDTVRDAAHIRGRKMLYSVLLKDALLKHLQDRSNLYRCSDADAVDVKKVMLWSEYQAYVLQVSQIGTSACGATAVINVLKYFDMYMDQERVCEEIRTNLRAETASVGEYLVSRSVAGTTAVELIAGLHTLTGGAIYGRFFHMYPERDVNIRKWLGEWMEKGAVPVVTLNRQRAIPQGWVVPDAWHHQMVYGVGPKGVYLTNPLEIVPEYVIQNQLCSESVLLVRRNDVVSRWHPDCHLGTLLRQPDPAWREMNVIGQVVNVLREDRAPRLGSQCPQLTSHITVPAWYRSGVTLCVRRDSPAYTELLALPDELPLRAPTGETSRSSAGSSLQQLFAEGGEEKGRDSPT